MTQTPPTIVTSGTARPIKKRSNRRFRGPAERIAQILDIATVVFNTSGASAQMVDSVATRAGLDRASLYYYFGSREELIYATYAQSCTLVLRYIDEACVEGRDGLDAIVQLARKAYWSAHPIATLSEVGLLGEKRHADLGRLRARITRGLTAMVQRGQEDGSITACRPELAARMLEGILAAVWHPWWDDLEATRPREVIADAIADAIINGRRPMDAPVSTSYAVPRELLAPPRYDGDDRDELAETRREAMLAAATKLLNTKGVNGTSLNEVTRSLNVTKGAFYHYFSSKDELLFQCYYRSQELVERYIAAVQGYGCTGLEMLQACTFHNLSIQLGSQGPLTQFNGYKALPAYQSDKITVRAAIAGAAMREMNYRGIEDGSIRPHDVTISQRVFGSASGWVSFWFEPDMGIDVQDIADTFIHLYSDGLKWRPAATAPHDRDAVTAPRNGDKAIASDDGDAAPEPGIRYRPLTRPTTG